MKAKACVDLERSMMDCFKVLKYADSDTANGLKQYIAYQFSTFLLYKQRQKAAQLDV